MDTENQNRAIAEVFGSIGNKNASLSKRLAGLETAEYAALNFYGAMYQDGPGTVIAIAVASTYYPITSMVTGLVKGWTFADPSLTCVKPGVYKVNYSLCVTGMANNHTHSIIRHNATTIAATHADILSTSPGGHQHLNGLGIFRAVAGDTITLMIANFTDVDDPTVDTASVVVERLGD